jgi:hypothetical protein
MSFRQAVEATPGLEAAYQPGLQALVAADRERITVTDTRRLCGSVDLDGALRTGPLAHAYVWDYAVCYPKNAAGVHWIEVHPASDHGVTDLLNKLSWLKQWLAGDGHRLKPMTAAFVWISSGKTTFTKASPSARRLAQQGVYAAGGHYHLT